jgi:hypothetical protein
LTFGEICSTLPTYATKIAEYSEDTAACTAEESDFDSLHGKDILLFFYAIHTGPGSRDGVVCIATVYGLDDRGVGVRVSVGVRIFSSPRRPDRL